MASLKFSQCGKYLHIISFGMPSSKRHGGNQYLLGADKKDDHQVTIHLLTYELPKEQSVLEDQPPDLIFSLRFSHSFFRSHKLRGASFLSNMVTDRVYHCGQR